MYTTTLQNRPCPVCSDHVHGRTDKRYCGIQCKNQHHNHSRRMNKPMTQEVNRQQMRNLTILEGVAKEKGMLVRIHKNALTRHGFHFGIVTGVQTEGNKIVYFCYHFSYTIGKDGIVNIRRNKKLQLVLPGFYERWEIDFPDEKSSKSGLNSRHFTFKTDG
ncbi:MAG: hypothetical protein KJ941_08280 [Bacteroidetes bacterium]|nr:hypothetical protein [Bacteroidota bacterium]